MTSTVSDLDDRKQAVRERVWAILDQEHITPPPGARGRIPYFEGAQDAADRLAEIAAWRDATVIKANPDWAQFPVRVRALAAAKTVYMAVPRLAEPRPFYLLDAASPPSKAAQPDVAARTATMVAIEEMQPVDLIVCGSVAVNRDGVRVGKGAGYSDIEVALLTEAGLIGPKTVFVTTVHGRQVLDERLPEDRHDFRVDVIVTPEEVITCGPTRRSTGLLWDRLSAEKIAAIPVLTRHAREKGLL